MCLIYQYDATTSYLYAGSINICFLSLVCIATESSKILQSSAIFKFKFKRKATVAITTKHCLTPKIRGKSYSFCVFNLPIWCCSKLAIVKIFQCELFGSINICFLSLVYMFNKYGKILPLSVTFKLNFGGRQPKP